MSIWVKSFFLFIIWYPLRSVVRLFTTRCGKYSRLLVLGEWLGSIFYAVFPLGRKIVHDELSALGLWKPEYGKLTFQHIMKIEMEGMVFGDLNRPLIEQITQFEGLQHLDESMKRGKGTVLTLFHFGWHMHTIPALGYMGYPIKQIADQRPVDLKAKPNFLQAMVIKKRLSNATNLPVTFLSAGAYLRPVIRELENNAVVILALDGREAKDYQPYPFLGRQILLSPTILRVAQKTGANVIPMFAYRHEDGRHRVTLHAPLSGADPDAMVKELLAIFETYIRERPYQYAQYMLGNALAARDPRRNLHPLFA